MKVILTCFQDAESFGPLTRRQSVAMLPVLNKPLLQHHLEQSVKRGQKEIHIVVVDYPSQVEKFLGNGSRWGIEPRVWFFRDACSGVEVLQRLCDKLQGPFLLIPVETLIDWNFDEIRERHESHSSGVSRVLSARVLSVAQVGRPALVEQGLLVDTGILITRTQFDPQAPITDIECNCRWIRIDDPRKLWAANLSALDDTLPCLASSGTRPQDGVCVGHHTRISSAAKVEGSNHIGNYVQIASGVALSGNSVLGDGTIIDENALVSASVILSNTYVGPEVDVRDSIVTGRFIMTMSGGTWVSITDPFILTDKGESVALSAAKGILEKACALVLAVATFPIWFTKGLTRVLKRKPFFDRRTLFVCDISEEPVCPEEGTRREFLCFSDAGPFVSRLPGLLDVLMGRIGLVGVRPLEDDELPMYRQEWTRRRFDSPEGLFTPVDAELAADALEEEKAVLENYYASTRNLWTDLKIVVRSMFNLMFKIHGRSTAGS